MGTRPSTSNVPSSTMSPIFTIGTPLRTIMEVMTPAYSDTRFCPPSGTSGFVNMGVSFSLMEISSRVPESLTEVQVISGKARRISFSRALISRSVFCIPTRTCWEVRKSVNTSWVI